VDDPTETLGVVAPDRRSWVEVPEGSDFPLQNLPFGIGRRVGEDPRLLVAIGDHALDLAAVAAAGWLDDLDGAARIVHADTLAPLLERDLATWRRWRARIADLLDVTDGRVADAGLAERVLLDLADVELLVPVRPGDVVDFYSSEAHATNVGRMFRPDEEPLLENWRHLPVGYHGRASTVVVSGTPVVRPSGQRRPEDPAATPPVGASERLDIELEVGFVTGGPSNPMGRAVDIADAHEHVFGFVLVDDWSARDIQAWEYRPLGPFLGKSFATSISPWVVTLDALAPYRVPGPTQDPAPPAYLRTSAHWGLDLDLEIALAPHGGHERVISRTGFRDMYWTPAQQLAHVTVNGTTIRPGDLYASGTVSGEDPGSHGSLLELSWNGTRPLDLGDGVIRTFLEDGDTVTLRGAGDRPGLPRIGLGEVAGTVLPAEA
jgi:fumarylacetoacetase